MLFDLAFEILFPPMYILFFDKQVPNEVGVDGVGVVTGGDAVVVAMSQLPVSSPTAENPNLFSLEEGSILICRGMLVGGVLNTGWAT